MENEPVYKPLSLADWILTLFITFIPLVNIVMLFVWAFDSNTHPSKANWAKARLIWILIALILASIFFGIFGFALFSFMKHTSGTDAF
ncbi:MAG: hypothetical protein ACOYMF_03235 [Bacteroidales bacterium]